MHHKDYSSIKQENQTELTENADAAGLKINGVFCPTAEMNEVLKT